MKKFLNILSYLLLCKLIFTQKLNAQVDSTTNPSINHAISVVQTVDDKSNFVDQMTPDSTLSLPFGVIKMIGAARYIIAIDSVKFKPTGAYFNAYAAIDFPGTTKKIAFEAMNIKFNPKGVVSGNQARLMLISDDTIKINNTVSLRLPADGTNWVEWDCNGFKAISLKGEFIFSKGKLLPDPEQTSAKVVTASFQIYTTDIHNFVTQVNITPFMIEGLKDWAFNVTSATVDMSELVNAPGMVFPTGYTNPNMVNAQMWSGFYLQNLKVKLPTEISKTGKRTELVVNNLLIDNMGVTGLFQINNVFATSEGSMNGWGFSLDELGVGFLCNNLNSGHIRGKVNIPVADTSQGLVYNANIIYNPTKKEADYNFTISPANDLKFNLFSAEVDLLNTSHIDITKMNGLFKPTAVLNGYIGFTNAKFNSGNGQLLFQDLTLITEAPYITNGIFTLHNINGGQTKAVKYPVSLNDITFGLSTVGKPIMQFSVTLNVMDQSNTGFGIGTLVLLKGKIDASQQNYTGQAPVSITKTEWKFDKVLITGFAIDLQTSPFTLEGGILFRSDDPVYGDGFYGSIKFAITSVMPQPAQINVVFGAKDSYRYFYVDAAIPVYIPLGNIPIALTKLMGGLFYHMSPQNSSQASLMAAVNSPTLPTGSMSPINYVPDPNISLGFKTGVTLIYSPSEVVFNGDVVMEIAFTSSGGLSYVKFGGDIYIMATRSQRPKAPIKGGSLMQYDFVNKIFDFDANIIINAYNSVTGTGTGKMHVENGTWYACVGKPSNPCNINVLGTINAQSYFMVGNSIEPALNPPPEVSAIINASGLAAYRNNSVLQSGAGFCTGAKIYDHFNKQFGFNFFNVSAYYNFGLGFDMMLMDYGANAHCSENGNPAGLNGWQSSGSMYIYMQGGVSVNGNLKWPLGCECDKVACLCKSFDITVFDAGVAALVNGKMPKPVYFSGQFGCYYNILGKVNGNFNFNYDYGSDCSVMN